jgi:hypothetical protein
MLLLAACSASGGGASSQIPLLTGLGSYSDSAASTPVVAVSSPTGQFAFVYDNQIWIKPNNTGQPHQLTKLPIATSAFVAWGPLVWSPDGSHIAFVLLRDPTGGHPARGTGPLYIVDTASGEVLESSGTANLAGHAYAWYGNLALFYAEGSGILFDDLSSLPDLRPWQIVSPQTGPDTSSGTPNSYIYTDIAVFNSSILATQIGVTAPGATGAAGRAHILQFFLNVGPNDYTQGNMNIGPDGNFPYGNSVADLGAAYVDGTGNIRAGSWRLAPNGALVLQRITAVDGKSETGSAQVCYNASLGNYCDQSLFAQQSKFPLNSPPQFAFSPNGNAVAMTGAALAIEQTDGTHLTSNTPGAWQTLAWSLDGKVVVATQLVSATPDSDGVVRYVTNVELYTGNGKGSVLIAGAQGFTWGP